MTDLVCAAAALDRMAQLLQIEEKSIASASRRFHADLRMLVTSGLTGDGSILADMRKLVKRSVEDAYFQGLAEGGIAPEDMDEEDAQNIVQLNLAQQDFVTAFVRAVREAKGDRAAQRDILDNRIELWTASIAAAGEAGLNSAKRNEMVEWRLGAAEEHCSDCTKLHGQKHRRKWFVSKNYLPRTPGAALECGGFNCQCEFRVVK